MGYKFQLKKQEREKLLREKSKNDLLGVRDDLFVQDPTAFAVTYTCNLRKQTIHLVRPGVIGLLVVDNERIVFWKTETLGYICEDDTPELMNLLQAFLGEPHNCLAEVVSQPTELCTCQLQLKHGG